MATTVVRPSDPQRTSAIRIAAVFAAITVLFHIALTLWVTHIGWGYFRDEFYYIACGRHLAWGYVDHGPLVAVQARLAETLFGDSIPGIRMLSALGGGARVFLTGLLTWSLGGRRAAQVLAMIGVLVAACYLGGDSYLSMNSMESLFWMTALLALTLMQRNPAHGGFPRLWLIFGAAAGLGLLNKPSMTFFLIALLAALLITPQRRLLFTPWSLAGIALMLAIVAPYVHWQIVNHWPTWEFLQNGRIHHKNVALAPLAFLGAQIQTLLPSSTLLWLPGLVWLARRPQWRWLALTYLLFLALMMALHAKDYYVVPIYPILFAAGGLAWQSWQEKRKPAANLDRIYGFPILETVLIVTAMAVLPMSNPILGPAQWVAYANALHLRNSASKTEKYETGPLPQFYADRFGWQEEVDQVERVAASLPPDQRARLTIVCQNYGEAGAIDLLGRNLPPAISGHNNYWLWGNGGTTGEVVILIEDTTVDHLHQFYDNVQVVGHMGTEYSMPFEHKDIFLLIHPRQPFTQLWPDHRVYI